MGRLGGQRHTMSQPMLDFLCRLHRSRKQKLGLGRSIHQRLDRHIMGRLIDFVGQYILYHYIQCI